MATKKVKRERNEAKHRRFMEQYRADGRQAQKRDRDRREREEWEAWRPSHDKNHGPTFNEKGCPICKKGVGLTRQPKESTA